MLNIFKKFNYWHDQIEEGLRPTIPVASTPPSYAKLMRRCWHNDPTQRPSMTVIVKKYTHAHTFIIKLLLISWNVGLNDIYIYIYYQQPDWRRWRKRFPLYLSTGATKPWPTWMPDPSMSLPRVHISTDTHTYIYTHTRLNVLNIACILILFNGSGLAAHSGDGQAGRLTTGGLRPFHGIHWDELDHLSRMDYRPISQVGGVFHGLISFYRISSIESI